MRGSDRELILPVCTVIGEADHKSVFIDGTKIESGAGRYTFTWRETAEKGLEKTKQKVLEQTGCKTLDELEALLSGQAAEITFVSGKTYEKKNCMAMDRFGGSIAAGRLRCGSLNTAGAYDRAYDRPYAGIVG